MYVIKNNKGQYLHFDDMYSDRPFPDNLMWIPLHYPDLLRTKIKDAADKMIEDLIKAGYLAKDIEVVDFYAAFKATYGKDFCND